MSVRLLICLVLAATCGLPRTVCAQAMPWNRGTGTMTLEVPASHAHGPGDPHGATSYSDWGSSPAASQGLWSADTVDGDVYGYGQPGHHGYPDFERLPAGCRRSLWTGRRRGRLSAVVQPAVPVAPQGRGPIAQTQYELLPQDEGLLYDEDIARIRSLTDRMRTAWFRMEYLNWDMRNPGNTLLGAPVAGIDNPRDPFLVTAIDGTGNLATIGTARVMDMTPVDLKNMQGRGSPSASRHHTASLKASSGASKRCLGSGPRSWPSSTFSTCACRSRIWTSLRSLRSTVCSRSSLTV